MEAFSLKKKEGGSQHPARKASLKGESDVNI